MASGRFTQADISRALAGARKEGWEAEEIRIAPSGEIVMRKARVMVAAEPEVDDEIDRWAAGHGS